MQSSVYQEWIQEDIKEAEARTLLQATRDSIVENLEARFDFVKSPLREKIFAITDLKALKALHKKSATAVTLEDFEKFLTEKL